MEKVVLDTNVVLSGTYWAGDSRKILKMLEEGTILAIASIEIVKEYLRILQHPDILAKIDEVQATRLASTQKLFQKLKIVDPKKKIKLSKDPDDDKFLEAAWEDAVKYIVSMDHDLLDLVEYQGIKILAPAEFLRRTSR